MALRSKAASKTEYNSRPFTKSNLAGRSFCLGVMPIPCPHFKITIVKRSQGQSAVAGAAYQSGERLFSEYDQRTKFYNKKKELVHAEIMLPSYAPPGYADRATLWNAVEAVENQWNSQLARRIVLAFPVEVPKEQYLSMIKEFCQEQFVSKGMIADFAIHDKGDGNPHAHILLTLRAIDEHGKWLPKARKVYDLDENGERIRLASGNWKCHKENTVDWNDQKYAEVWRHGWETITNRYLEAAGRPERVDLRSFERQGIQQIPTVHLGPAAHQMEKRGVETFLGNLNRDIRAANSLMQSIRSAIRGLQRWIADLNEKKQILLDALEQAKEPMLSDLLVDYFNLRNEQRSDWSGKAKLKCTGCAHLVDAGRVPHCVDVCSHGAIRFGDEEDFAEEIARAEALDSERADRDRPRVYYLNLPKRFLAGIVIDPEEDEVIIGAKVTAENVNTGEVLVTQTDEFGDFWFHQVDAAAWRVYVEADGYMTRVFDETTVEEDRNTGPLELYKNAFK